MAASEGRAGGPVIRPRHAVSALTMIDDGGLRDVERAPQRELGGGRACRSARSTDPTWPEPCGLAVICLAGGLGLLTGSSIGLWLGRLAAAVLFALGASFLWDSVTHPTYSMLFGDYSLVFVVPVSVLLMGPAFGMLLALRPGARRRAAASKGSDTAA